MPTAATPPDDASPLMARSRAMVTALQQQWGAQLIETHISWVLIHGQHAWKVKKPVCLPFVDARLLSTRRHLCEEEWRLNRRLAPALYLGVQPITGTETQPGLNGPGAAQDYAVHMQAFAAEALASTALKQGRLQARHLEDFAQTLARFHRAARGPLPAPHLGAPANLVKTVEAVVAQLAAFYAAEPLAAITTWLAEQAQILRPLWLQRQRDGHVVEGHGDLHLDNLILQEDQLQAFDGIDFNLALRWIDAMQDMAFLTMDLMAHDRTDLAAVWLNAYLDASGDHAGLPLLRHAMVYRALVRALVAYLRGPDHAAEAQPYLRLVHRLMASGDVRLLITHGLSGSGKSHLSGQLLQRTLCVRLRSDVERKRLFAHTSPQSLYSTMASEQTYQHLRSLSQMALQAGWRVIVDGCFLKRAQRDAFRALAHQLHAPFAIVHCEAPVAELERRLIARQAQGQDPSDADIHVLAQQRHAPHQLDADECDAVLAGEQAPDAIMSAWLKRTAS